jgi:hypothetical protein
VKVGILIIALLTLSCLILISPVVAAFSAVGFGQPAKFDINSGSCIVQAILFRPDDPGSGGGSAGVI